MDHSYFMQKALDLAAKGWPLVAPNPMVGCVIVRKDEVVSSGYHKKYGEAHAEVNAVNDLPEHVDPGECVLYVTLEPCSHHGKTPPCTDLLIRKGFKKIVIACRDPNPLVSGSGIRKLLEAGMEVIPFVLEQEARELNRRFVTFYEKKRPYIILKWAITADGFIAREPHPEKRSDNMITREPARRLVHQFRAETMAILVGKHTVLKDNPLLNTRLVDGKSPVRIFIDGRLEVPGNYNIYNNDGKTIVFNCLKEGEEGHIRFVRLDENENVALQVVSALYRLNVQSLLVEGGAVLLNDFIGQGLWDEALVFQNPDLYFRQGLKGPVFPLKNTFELVGEDKLFRHRKNESIGGPVENETF